ncbi:MAG: hydroxyacid dehydrogenase [Clostridia bacterium]|nr:hydroxyacid dehydrogenase [Clostridia bacterium]
MNIVMLEPLGVKPEALEAAFAPFKDAGHAVTLCTAKLTEEEKIARAKDADIFVIANSPLTAAVINAAENLKMVCVAFTGIDHVDLDACRAKDVRVCNAQGYATEATAEVAIGMMLSCLRNLVPYDKVVREGGVLAGYKHNTLQGKTVGIVGTGAIGCRVMELAKAFGCKILAYSKSQRQAALDLGAEYVDLETLFAESDIVSLHTPLNAETKGLVSRELITKMKETAILVNCARGAVVDSEALAEALNEGRIHAAGIDVYEMEPPIPAEHPLLNARNAYLTPHVGFFSEESLLDRLGIVIANVDAFLKGAPINVKL